MVASSGVGLFSIVHLFIFLTEERNQSKRRQEKDMTHYLYSNSIVLEIEGKCSEPGATVEAQNSWWQVQTIDLLLGQKNAIDSEEVTSEPLPLILNIHL